VFTLLLAGLLIAMPQRSLAPCPDKNNCVSTEATTDKHRMAPVPFSDSAEQALARVRAALLEEPRITIVGEETGWLKAEARSRIFRFVDDVEFIIDADAKLIRFRSASRVGESDLGVNRKRMTRISERLRASGH
jgi:uncharacterized protein (DUF1499 family)